MGKKEDPKPIYKDGFDSKNRMVVLIETEDVFHVTKPSTGFYQECLTLEEAETVYAKQINCSHN